MAFQCEVCQVTTAKVLAQACLIFFDWVQIWGTRRKLPEDYPSVAMRLPAFWGTEKSFVVAQHMPRPIRPHRAQCLGLGITASWWGRSPIAPKRKWSAPAQTHIAVQKVSCILALRRSSSKSSGVTKNTAGTVGNFHTLF